MRGMRDFERKGSSSIRMGRLTGGVGSKVEKEQRRKEERTEHRVEPARSGNLR